MSDLERLMRFVRQYPFIVWLGFAMLLAFIVLMLALLGTV